MAINDIGQVQIVKSICIPRDNLDVVLNDLMEYQRKNILHILTDGLNMSTGYVESYRIVYK